MGKHLLKNWSPTSFAYSPFQAETTESIKKLFNQKWGAGASRITPEDHFGVIIRDLIPRKLLMGPDPGSINPS